VTAPAPIAPPEHRARQQALRALAHERGYDAVVAWSRCGGTQDHHADVYWLTGFYTHQPFVGDLAGRWRATGHAAAVVPAGGPVTVIADTEQRQDPQPVADEIVVAADPVAAAAETLARAGGRRIALLGGEALAARWARALDERLPGATVIEDDGLAWALRAVKSPPEQALLRAAGALGARAMAAALAAAVPGATEAEVAAALVTEVTAAGGAPFGLVLSSSAWAHTLAPSGGPAGAAAYTTRALREGDLLRLDAYGSLGGYLFDLARSRVVGRPPDDEQRALLEAVVDSVAAGVERLRPGVTLGEVARRCDEVLAASAYARDHGMPHSPMDGAWGHGIGVSFEPPWIDPGSEVVVAEGMCLAIELRIEAPGLGGAQYEDDVLVTGAGPEVLTQPQAT